MSARQLTTNEFDEWGNPKQTAFYDYMLSYSPYDNMVIGITFLAAEGECSDRRLGCAVASHQ